MTNEQIIFIFAAGFLLAALLAWFDRNRHRERAARAERARDQLFDELREVEAQRDGWEARCERLGAEYRALNEEQNALQREFLGFKQSVAPLVLWVGQCAKARLS